VNTNDKIQALKIPFRIPMSPEIVLDRFVYVHMIFGDTIYLIDTGVAAAKDVIFDHIARSGREHGEIDKVFISHAHPDHIGSLKAIKETTGCEVLAHEKARKWIEDTEAQFRERPVPGFRELVAGPCGVDKIIRDGDIFSPGKGLTVRAIYTPGHSMDSVSFYVEEYRMLISGDTLILPGEMPIYDEYGELKDTLRKLGQMDIDILASSWAEQQEGDDVKWMIDRSAAYLEKINEVVRSVSGGVVPEDRTRFCEECVKKLGLPPVAVNPLVARSFLSHIRP
jgi:hydroxyacylglutathione hydrolase